MSQKSQPHPPRKNQIRALKACESCRRQKTRCYPSEDPNGSCLRCFSVGRDCSFIADGAPPPPIMSRSNADGEEGQTEEHVSGDVSKKRTGEINSNDKKRIKETHNNVKKIIDLLSKGGVDMLQGQFSSSFNTRNTTDSKIVASDGHPNINVSPGHTSPFFVIKSSVETKDFPAAIEQILSPSSGAPLEEEEPPNILSLGIVTLEDATLLVDKFKEGYGKWISLPESVNTEELITDLKFRCPILLTAICLTSLRYKITRSRTKDEESFQRQLSIRLGQELKEFLTSPNEFKSFEFLKALVILSVNGLSLSNQELNIDPWLLSGLAIQWFLTLDINRSFLTNEPIVDDGEVIHYGQSKQEEALSNYRIWNHLCLAHLSSCVFSGRMCVLDEIRLNQTRKALELSQTTNFDGRMIAEISLQLLLYNFIQSTTINTSEELDSQFDTFEEDIKHWNDQWEHLFKQPEEQFVEFGYHYSYVVALYHYKLGNTSLVGVKPGDEEEVIQDFEILNKMLYHSLKVLNHILKLNNNEVFIVLSDQIHFCLFYVSIIFLKVIRWIDIVDKGETYNKDELHHFIEKVESIRTLFNTVSRVDTDLAKKYSVALETAIEETKEFINV